ncbi:lipopolysaccharide heptosyltransferase I [Lacisediminimonas sp.]|uniref:lipopolysaccharide heptosyltransferase I n=1 Tax=Lacisediminimonas sp. TaxID=3060582 RepID=UPI00271ADFCA|nr:lipopolysaccharide heptosyltransferase I [Lacisediminimonas sp.]MDO8298546.1 lipopolysaccharide heptosyltransferase I [Lacisediminimonas sp.]
MKILLVRVSSLGDVVHNMPMVADLQRRFPGAQIDWVVEESYVDLVRLHPGVHRIIPFALRRWRRSLFKPATRTEIRAFLAALRQETYDMAFDTQGLLKTGLVLGLARLKPGAPRIGLANATEGSGYEGASRLFHTRSIAVPRRCHAVERGRLVAAQALAYPIDTAPDFGMALPVAADGGRWPWMPAGEYAVFFHGTARAAKKWPVASWIALARMLDARGMPVLLPWGSEQEQQVAQQIAAGSRNCTVLPRLPMMQAVGLAAHAALAVGVDTGLTHVAAAYQRPTVEIYCDSPRWKTEGNWSPNIINLGDQGQAPGIDAVWQAVASLLPHNAGPSA